MLAQQSSSVYAVKVVPKAKVVTHKQIDQILAELKILKLVYQLTGCVCVILHICVIAEK